MEHVILQNTDLMVEISPQGAEIQRIRDAGGVERLWNGDPAYWPGRSPVLFPIAGAFKDDTYTLDGKSYTLGKHGFARESLFAIETANNLSATFLLTDAMAFQPGFPFGYAFRVRYTLEGNAIRTEHITSNTGTDTFYFAVGAHEAYACPEGSDAYEIVFEKPENLVRGVLDGSYLTNETEPVPTQGNVLPIQPRLFDNDSLVFAQHNSRSAILRSRLNNRQVRIDYADFDYLLIWTKPGAGFLCFEPWSNLPDYLDSDHDIAKKPGMTRLTPGESKTFTHTVTFS